MNLVHDRAAALARENGQSPEAKAASAMRLAADALAKAQQQAQQAADSAPETRPLVIAKLTGAYPHPRVTPPREWYLRAEWANAMPMLGIAVVVGGWPWIGASLAATPLTVPLFNLGLWYWRQAVKMFRVLLSAAVTDAEYDARNEVCWTCPDAEVDLARFGPSERFCGRCDCGRRWGARLSKKNRYAGWRCPAGRFSGVYSDEDQRRHLVALGYDTATTREIARVTKGGKIEKPPCGRPGCNGSK